MTTSLTDLRQLALDVVRRAGEIARTRPTGADVTTKAHRNDLVTAMDKKIEEVIAGELAASTGYPLLGEEGHTVDSFAGRVWVLDPIDGTLNFVETHRDFAISLALVEDGVPIVGVVYDVMANRAYSAIAGEGAWCDEDALDPVAERDRTDIVVITDLKELRALPRLARVVEESRGHRRYGSAALECVEVAAGRAGAFVHLWVSPWDIAAAMVICAECGVRVTRLDATPLDVRHPGSILAAVDPAHGEIVHALNQAATF